VAADGSGIGVAVVGLGVGEQHARAYLATGRCQLRWLYDLEASQACSVAEKLGAGTVARCFEQILEDPDVQAVSIASYDDAHFAQVVAALDAGKHVFVEKPLCRTVDELLAIKHTWSKHGGKLKLSSNLVLRTAPVYQWLQQKVEAGDFGNLYAFDGDYLYGRLHKITQGWRKAVEPYSVMLGGGVHLVDLMLWLIGERPASVYATGNRICTENTGFRYYDYVAATLRCPSGLIGRITANFGCVHRHQHMVRLFGTEATFVCDDAGPRLHVARDPSAAVGARHASPVHLPTLPATKGELIAPFVSAILADANLNAHSQTIFDVISICAACDQALQLGSEVEVRYV
jgi:predicted dehydrogenase